MCRQRLAGSASAECPADLLLAHLEHMESLKARRQTEETSSRQTGNPVIVYISHPAPQRTARRLSRSAGRPSAHMLPTCAVGLSRAILPSSPDTQHQHRRPDSSTCRSEIRRSLAVPPHTGPVAPHLALQLQHAVLNVSGALFAVLLDHPCSAIPSIPSSFLAMNSSKRLPS
jgi:hypothetical protein